MSNSLFVIAYVEGCAKGAIGTGDCGPVWQLGVIAGLLVAAIVALGVMRLRAAVSGTNSPTS